MVIKNNQPLVRVALTDAVPKLLRVALNPPVRPELLRVALTAGVLAENLEVALTQVHVYMSAKFLSQKLLISVSL